jgi:integrase
MPRSAPVPSYRLHKPSGQAVVTIRTAAGERRDVYLGAYNSKESRAEYGRIVAELATAAAPENAIGETPSPTVDQVAVAFWVYALGHYKRPDGTPTQEISEYHQSIRVLRKLYAHTRAADFGPLALKAVRNEMVKKGWSRKLVNGRVGRIRRMFKWAASGQLVPVAVHQALGTVQGLQKGRGDAPETEPVKPVAWEHVSATLPFLRPPVAAMVMVQWHTGMRPNEVCALRPCDIDRTGAVWLYRPPYSKMSYKGQKRVIAIGPRAQAVLEQFEPAKPTDYYFSPRASVAQFHAERAANRKTPKYASHMTRNATRPKGKERKPQAKYKTASYGYAIRKAVERANRPYVEAAVELEFHAPEWAPNQLRHAHATAVRHRFDLESAQAVLGHERMNTTEIYAEKNLALAVKVAKELG